MSIATLRSPWRIEPAGAAPVVNHPSQQLDGPCSELTLVAPRFRPVDGLLVQ